MVQQNQSPFTRPGFGLRFTAEIRFLGTANQPSFAALKKLVLIVLYHSKMPSAYHGRLTTYFVNPNKFLARCEDELKNDVNTMVLAPGSHAIFLLVKTKVKIASLPIEGYQTK